MRAAAVSRGVRGGGYADVPEGAWYAEAVRWAASQGVMGGYGSGQLDPHGLATRAQVPQMLKNFIENLEDD